MTKTPEQLERERMIDELEREPEYMPGNVRWFKANGRTWKIRKCSDGLWRDVYRCIYALAEDENSVDAVDRCGIGIFSLPENHPANRGCQAHDFKYSSLAYQLYHTRKEADDDLERDLKTLGYSWFGRIARRISRWFGGMYWENEGTR